MLAIHFIFMAFQLQIENVPSSKVKGYHQHLTEVGKRLGTLLTALRNWSENQEPLAQTTQWKPGTTQLSRSLLLIWVGNAVLPLVSQEKMTYSEYIAWFLEQNNYRLSLPGDIVLKAFSKFKNKRNKKRRYTFVLYRVQIFPRAWFVRYKF